MDVDLTPIFKALSHPKRIAILQALQQGESCVCDLEVALGLRQAYLSQQLSVLREAGLVCYRRAGWKILYRIAHPEVTALLEMAAVVHSQLGPCVFSPAEEITSASTCESLIGELETLPK